MVIFEPVKMGVIAKQLTQYFIKPNKLKLKVNHTFIVFLKSTAVMYRDNKSIKIIHIYVPFL